MGEKAAEWAWCVEGDERAHGPFETREEAVADAAESNEDASKIVFGHVQWADPCAYVDAFCPTMILSVLDEHAFDCDFAGVDDEVFQLSGEGGGRKQAKAELHAALVPWLRKWVTGDAWIIDPEPKPDRVG